MAPATPNTVNAAAKAKMALPISERLIAPSAFKHGVNMARAVDMTSMEAAAPNVPFINRSAVARIIMELASTTIPFPISSHFMPPVS